MLSFNLDFQLDMGKMAFTFSSNVGESKLGKENIKCLYIGVAIPLFMSYPNRVNRYPIVFINPNKIRIIIVSKLTNRSN